MIDLLPPGLPTKEHFKCPQCNHKISLREIHHRFSCPACHVSLSSNMQQSRIISLLAAIPCFLLLFIAILLIDQKYYQALTSNSYYLVTALFCAVVVFYIAHLLFLLLFKIKTKP